MCTHAPSHSSKNGWISSKKSRGYEVKAKLNDSTVDCKSFAWFMILCYPIHPHILWHVFRQPLFFYCSVKSHFFEFFLTFLNGKYHSREKRRQTCGYMSAEEIFFIFKIALWDDDCLSSGYHSRRLTRSDGLWSIVCFSKEETLVICFSFLVHTKMRWRKNWVTNSYFFCVCSRKICLFLPLYLFLISIVRYERAWIFKKRLQKVFHLIINRENVFYDFGYSWQQMKKR